MHSHSQIRIGSRGSPLALAQAKLVANLMVKAGIAIKDTLSIKRITTTGDHLLDSHPSELRVKGLFTKEIDNDLLSGKIDMAVHSVKDLPAILPSGLDLACILSREDPREVLFGAESISSLKKNAIVGTASVRRKSQILNQRPDISFINFRGNVQTRLRKIKEGKVDATLLAYAGLLRLGLDNQGGSVLETDEILPAPAQGVIGIVIRRENKVLKDQLSVIQDVVTAQAVGCERALLTAVDGSCRTPIAALANIDSDGSLILRASLFSLDGVKRYDIKKIGLPDQGEEIGRNAGLELVRKAGGNFSK